MHGIWCMPKKEWLAGKGSGRVGTVLKVVHVVHLLTYASFGHLRLLRRNPLWLNQGIYLLHCPELLHDAQHACGYPCWGGQQTIQRPFNRLDDSKTNATHALCLLIHLGYYFRRPPRICCWTHTHTHTHFHDLLLMSWAGSNLTFSSKLQFQLLVLTCHSRAPSQSKSLRPNQRNKQMAYFDEVPASICNCSQRKFVAHAADQIAPQELQDTFTLKQHNTLQTYADVCVTAAMEDESSDYSASPEPLELPEPEPAAKRCRRLIPFSLEDKLWQAELNSQKKNLPAIQSPGMSRYLPNVSEQFQHHLVFSELSSPVFFPLAGVGEGDCWAESWSTPLCAWESNNDSFHFVAMFSFTLWTWFWEEYRGD